MVDYIYFLPSFNTTSTVNANDVDEDMLYSTKQNLSTIDGIEGVATNTLFSNEKAFQDVSYYCYSWLSNSQKINSLLQFLQELGHTN